MNYFGKVPILGVGVNPINIPAALDLISIWIDEQKQNYVCVVPAHSVMDGYHDAKLRTIFNESGLSTPDGMAIVWILRLLGYKNVRRVYGPDLMQSVCELSTKYGWRHFFYGGAPGVSQKLVECLQQKNPDLQVAGIYSPPFRPLKYAEDMAVIEKINDSETDIVWVGISSPKQEYWMREHLGKINAPVMVGVGAAFDFLSGNKRQAPSWIQRSGFEWLYRFVEEPRRLWPRYKQYPLFVILVILQLLGLRKFHQ